MIYIYGLFERWTRTMHTRTQLLYTDCQTIRYNSLKRVLVCLCMGVVYLPYSIYVCNIYVKCEECWLPRRIQWIDSQQGKKYVSNTTTMWILNRLSKYLWSCQHSASMWCAWALNTDNDGKRRLLQTPIFIYVWIYI